ncbi:MAG TPA: ABC transporter [Planctomycetes bacterium]|nr:ABC transporter [Planctomycetota bacterium]|tara:strand:+ start:932 stop:1864 length:933 start_codon:yes stop_codon:yes gene_type:complete
MADSHAMEARGLKVAFGGLPILKGVDLCVESGDLYGLLGRNGAGKTTALRCLLGLLPQATGELRVLGAPANSIHDVPYGLGVALDPPGMDDSLTVRENLELACVRGSISGGRGVDEVLSLVGLAHRAGNRGDKLSHGQSRRAAVARALLGSPRLLVMDEPLSGLDPEGVETLLALFRRLSRDEGVTIVVSSHHLREVEEVCTRVGLIDGGRTLLEGEVRDLLEEAGDGLELRCSREEVATNLLSEMTGVREVDNLGDGLVRARLDAQVDLEAVLKDLVHGECRITSFTPIRASLIDVFHKAVRQADAEAR